MRVDSNKFVYPEERGRDSVRITSANSYGEVVIVLDIAHMPEGCATWPAFWTLSRNGPWPNGGEIDIIEGEPPSLHFPHPLLTPPKGVNLNTANLASLHTTPGCDMNVDRTQGGYVIPILPHLPSPCLIFQTPRLYRLQRRSQL